MILPINKGHWTRYVLCTNCSGKSYTARWDKKVYFCYKMKGIILYSLSCFFVLSTLSLWNRVNGVHWWRGEQGVLVQGWREYHGPNNSARNLRNDQIYCHYWYNCRVSKLWVMPLETGYFCVTGVAYLLWKVWSYRNRNGGREMSTEFSFSKSPSNRIAAGVNHAVNGEYRCGLTPLD